MPIVLICLSSVRLLTMLFSFFFNDTATTEIYTLSLHDALPIFGAPLHSNVVFPVRHPLWRGEDRKSTRLNSSHVEISYAVFCLKKKKQKHNLKYANLLKRHIQLVTLHPLLQLL